MCCRHPLNIQFHTVSTDCDSIKVVSPRRGIAPAVPVPFITTPQTQIRAMIFNCLRKLSHIQERGSRSGSEHRNRYRYLRLKQHRRRHPYPRKIHPPDSALRKWPTDAIPLIPEKFKMSVTDKGWSARYYSNPLFRRRAVVFASDVGADAQARFFNICRHFRVGCTTSRMWLTRLASYGAIRGAFRLPRVWPSSLPPRPDRTLCPRAWT